MNNCPLAAARQCAHFYEMLFRVFSQSLFIVTGKQSYVNTQKESKQNVTRNENVLPKKRRSLHSNKIQNWIFHFIISLVNSIFCWFDIIRKNYEHLFILNLFILEIYFNNRTDILLESEGKK